MRLFAELAAAAAPASDFAKGREALGDRYAEVACEAMRAGMKRLLIDERGETQADLRAAGELAAREKLISIAHEAIEKVAEAGR